MGPKMIQRGRAGRAGDRRRVHLEAGRCRGPDPCRKRVKPWQTVRGFPAPEGHITTLAIGHSYLGALQDCTWTVRVGRTPEVPLSSLHLRPGAAEAQGN